jgi:hypothetical protein
MEGFRYLEHKEIDLEKWDQCISHSPIENIYGYSEYLDTMAAHWDALVLNDYQAVLPLPWKKKFGFDYIYTPRFTSPLAIYGPLPADLKPVDILEHIPPNFRLYDLNLVNDLTSVSSSVVKRKNHVLHLLPSYEALRKKYRPSYRNMLNQQGNLVIKEGKIDRIIQLASAKQSIQGTNADDYARFERLYLMLSKKGKAFSFFCHGPNMDILAAAVFFLSQNRIYYMLSWNNEEGRNRGASHHLIDAVINDYAGKDYWLDFEGSDIPGIAFFFEGFGATPEAYYFLRKNKLPWWCRWMKE